MAKMGLSVRDDPQRVIDVESRHWGELVDGLQLSIAQTDQTLSVVLRNTGQAPRTLHYQIEIETTLTPFGREQLKREPPFMNPTIGPGELAETQIPLGSLFVLNPNEHYRIQLAATLPEGQTLRSNVL